MNKHPKKDEMVSAIKDMLKDGHPTKDIKDYIEDELKKEPDPPHFSTIYEWIKEVAEKIQGDGWISQREAYRNKLLTRKKQILDDLEQAYDLETDPKEKRKIGQIILKHPLVKHI